MKLLTQFGSILLIIFCISCQNDPTLFVRIPASSSGIHFANNITESDSFNILDMENLYNGGGVGIGDFNLDGLEDIYFTGNMVSNKLYLNKGNMEFEDITESAGVTGEGKWSRGISVVDINNDGWPDIYVSSTISTDSGKRENILYINQGKDKNGCPVFIDQAAEYGLNDNSHTTQSAFFDYDNDGDLDVYLAVNVFARRDNPNAYRRKFVNGEHPNTDRLYENRWDSAKGHPVFRNVSREAGILQEGFAHGLVICDLNRDGWKDIMVTNDYLSENLLYINNGNKTFTNRSKEYFKHTSYNSMGVDVVDINNDGLSDVVELDMNPEDNYRKKTMLGAAKYQGYLYNNDYGYQYQYVRNNLHLNRGSVINARDSSVQPVFSEIGLYSGIAETDWSWAPVVADFDQDGHRDIVVTNGFPKDITDQDFMAFSNSSFAMNAKEKLLAQIPEVKIPNYAFRNLGELRFGNAAKEWGLDDHSFSNGAATADLDNDGDLDLVMNNINEQAFLYENRINDQIKENHHYLKVKLEGDPFNRQAFGSWIRIYYGDQMQVYETNPVRGYLSSLQNLAFFGLGSCTQIDSLVVIWPDHAKQTIKALNADQELLIKKEKGLPLYAWSTPSKNNWFSELNSDRNLVYEDRQKDCNDFAIQVLLPHKLSQYGPYLATADVDGNGTGDVVINRSNGRSPLLLLQNPNGSFRTREVFHSGADTSQPVTGMGLALFDADGDGDQDLYLAKGGYEEKPGSSLYQDQFFINDGKGNFTEAKSAIPQIHSSKSVVRAGDFDHDGDLDLFIGGRVEPWRYPKPVSSNILRNQSKNGVVRFEEVTEQLAPSLRNIGLVCDALWTDYDSDGWTDLVLAGEWMPLRFFRNHQGTLVDETHLTGMADKTGWWNCLASADIDGDGDMDFIAGNIGGNSFFTNHSAYPLNNYYADFDNNGTAESITTKYLKDRDGQFREFTTAGRDEVVDQLPSLKKKFLSYKSFAETPFNRLFPEEKIRKAYHLKANYFSTSIILNNGNGRFQIQSLPAEAQFSSVSSISARDFNGDGKIDLLLVGNDFSPEVAYGRLDAFSSLLLSGNGKGSFTPISLEESGVYAPGDAKHIISVPSEKDGDLILVSQNKGPLKAFRSNMHPLLAVKN